MRELCAVLALNLYYIFSKGEKTMMAMLFAQRVILEKANFTAVKGEPQYIPPTLQPKVAEVLMDSGLPELVPARFGGTAKE